MTIYRRDYLICPWCNAESGCRVDHLYTEPGRSFGPWRCEECRLSLRGVVDSPGNVRVFRHGTQAPEFTRSMALLRFDGKEGPVFFVMDHDRYRGVDDDTDAANQEHQRYHFEEHSCPTNWLDECVCVIENGDTDPHGFLSFVRAADVPDDFDDHEADWRALFPEAFADT